MTIKKLLSIILTLVMMLSIFSLTGCTDSKSKDTKDVSAKKEVEADTIKIGLIAPQTGPVISSTSFSTRLKINPNYL